MEVEILKCRHAEAMLQDSAESSIRNEIEISSPYIA